MQVDSTAPAQASQEVQETTTAPVSSASRWLNRVFVVVILVALPLTYYFGYIGKDWLNKLGIILNFAAGFMLAPELIGEERLKISQEFVDHAIVNARNLIDKIISTILPAGKDFDRAIRIILEWLFVFALLTIFWTLEIYYLFYFVLFLAYIITIVGYVSSTSPKSNVFARTLYYVSVLLVPLVLIGILPLFIVLAMIILSLYSIILLVLNYLSKKISGNDRLRSILVWWGIIFFIVGNALQFIGSF